MTTRQVAALGVSERSGLPPRRRRRLHRVHRGVYAVGHPVLTGMGGSAAVLAGGEGAVLSHASAAALSGRAPATRSGPTSPFAGAAERSGQDCASTAHARSSPTKSTTHEGIPVTTPACTILDLAAMLGRRPLERVLYRTELLELTDYPAPRDIAPRPPRAPRGEASCNPRPSTPTTPARPSRGATSRSAS